VVYVDEEFGELISDYSLEQAIEDGVLVEIFKDMWKTLSHGKPIVVTRKLFEDTNQHLLFGVVTQFIKWKTNVQPTLPEEERLFTDAVKGKTVWVMEDTQAITMMYPEDY